MKALLILIFIFIPNAFTIESVSAIPSEIDEDGFIFLKGNFFLLENLDSVLFTINGSTTINIPDSLFFKLVRYGRKDLAVMATFVAEIYFKATKQSYELPFEKKWGKWGKSNLAFLEKGIWRVKQK